VFLSIGWIVFYINAITKTSAASVDPSRVVACRHVPIVAGSFLEAQSIRLQASVSLVGTLVPLSELWHFNGAGLDSYEVQGGRDASQIHDRGNAYRRCAPQPAKLVDRRTPTSALQAVPRSWRCCGSHTMKRLRQRYLCRAPRTLHGGLATP